MGRSRYSIVDETAPHFVTCSVLHWLPIFTHPDTVNIVLDSLRYLQNKGLKVYAWVVLENHLHLLVQSEQLSKDMASFKSFTARQLLDYLKQRNAKVLLDQFQFYKKAHKDDRDYQFWQEDYHPELIVSDDMMRQKIDYIHHNPVKRGYVDFAEHWRYSSARDYMGGVGLLEIHKRWWNRPFINNMHSHAERRNESANSIFLVTRTHAPRGYEGCEAVHLNHALYSLPIPCVPIDLT